MINRRHIRIKVMQAAYSLLISGEDNLDKQEVYLVESFTRLHQLYTLQLQLFVAIFDKAVVQFNSSKKNFLQTDSLLVNSSNFAQNKLLLQLKDSPTLGNYPLDQTDVKWENHKEIVMQLWKKIAQSKTFDTYMHLSNPTFEDDKIFVLDLFKKHIAPNEKLSDFYEAEVISWVDDIPFVNTWILNNFKKLNAKSIFNPDVLYKDKQDKYFGLNLFRKTVLNFDKYQKDIDKQTPNWDTDRITKIDQILMVMGVVEFHNFPSIPTKVTINEYIEIAKDYATAKSSYFINGVLDKLLEGYLKDEKIEKIGRGLL